MIMKTFCQKKLYGKFIFSSPKSRERHAKASYNRLIKELLLNNYNKKKKKHNNTEI